MAWLPLVGPWIERGRGATKILGQILQRRKEGVSRRRSKIAKALAVLSKPIVVVLDDIDRLSTSESRDVFKLVRLTASFPNIIYILAFDRLRIEKALSEQGVPGRDYLEKILQVAIDLPPISGQVLNRQIFSAVNGALATIENSGRFDEEVWPDVFVETIRPLIRNMRDVRRCAAAIHGTVRALQGQIALADVLALEAVRVFLPDVFGRLHGAVEGLTRASGRALGGRGDPPELKAQVDGLVSATETHGDVVRAMIERLFPAAQRYVGGSHYGSEWKGRWLRERRVAHEDILRLYLERVAGEGLQAFTEAEQAWIRMADRDALEGYLRSLEASRVRDVISSLEAYEDEFAPEHVVPGTNGTRRVVPHYACLDRKRRGDAVCTNPVVLPQEVLDRAILDAIVEALRPEVLARAVEKAIGKVKYARSYHASRRAQAEKELAEVQRRIDRLVDALSDGTLPADEIKARLGAEKTRKMKLTADLERAEQLARIATLDGEYLRRQLQERAGEVIKVLGRQTVQARQMLRKILAEKIELEPVGVGRDRGYKFRGALTVEKLIDGEALRTHPSVVAPTGFEPVFQP